MVIGWREVDGRISRGNGQLQVITELYHHIEQMRESDTWEKVFSSSDANGLKKKKNSFKNLFSASTKFQRTLKKYNS